MSRGRDIDDREKPANETPSVNPTGPSSIRDEAQDEDRDDIGRGRAGEGDSGRKPPDTRDEPSRDKSTRTKTRQRHDPVRTKEKTYVLTERDVKTMLEIGKFRAVTESDIEQFGFEGDQGRATYDLRQLIEQGLVRRETVTSRRGERLKVIALTRDGKRFLDSVQRRNDPGDGPKQHYYSDLKKPAEIFRDTAIYRMYQAEAGRIRSSGGRIRRVVLDYELKKKLYSPLAKARAVSTEEYSRCQQDVARENGLKVIDGKILLPDLRIEYETREGEIDKVDLELATEHYKGHQLASKLRAGFRIYIGGSDRSTGTPVHDERELTAGILSL